MPAVIIAQHTVAALPARAAAQAQLLAQGLDLVDRWVYGTPVSLGALQDTQRALCNYRIPLGTMLHRLLGAILHVEATDTLRALRPALIADLVRWSLLTIAAPQRTIADNAAKDRIRHAVPWARVAAQL